MSFSVKNVLLIAAVAVAAVAIVKRVPIPFVSDLVK